MYCMLGELDMLVMRDFLGSPTPYLVFHSFLLVHQGAAVLWQLEHCRRQGKVELPKILQVNPSPLEWKVWQDHLHNHPDKNLADYVIQGIRDGFRVGFDYAHHRTKQASSNMKSALEHATVVQEYLAKECAEGRVLGPFNLDRFPLSQINRFGVIPKGTTGKWRLILDLSLPKGFSVSDDINPEWCSMSYVTVEDAAKIVTCLGRRTQLAKVDIKSAYRIIPVHPEDRLLLGMQWENKLYIDAALPFGLRSAPKIFSAVGEVLEWRARFEGATRVLHYLDDFLMISPAVTKRQSGP